LSQVKNKLKSFLKDKEIIDIFLFGSGVKGRAIPRDIDIVIITEKKIEASIPGVHISILKPKDFFVNPPTLATTILREGYSLRKGKSFSELLRFDSRVLFSYQLSLLSNSEKVRTVNVLRGKNRQKGMVESYNGLWVSTSVFIISPEHEYLFEQFFIDRKIKFKKIYLLLH
jgi:predicted nucleotidyltransferase